MDNVLPSYTFFASLMGIISPLSACSLSTLLPVQHNACVLLNWNKRTTETIRYVRIHLTNQYNRPAMAPADTVDCWYIKDRINKHNGEEYDCLSHVLDHYSTLSGKHVVVLAVHPSVLADTIAKTDLFKDFGITHHT